MVKKPSIATRAEMAAYRVTRGLGPDESRRRIRDYFYVGWLRGYTAAKRDAKRGGKR